LFGAHIFDRVDASAISVLLLVQALKRLLTCCSILGHVYLVTGSKLLGDFRIGIASNLLVNHGYGWRHRLDLSASLLVDIFSRLRIVVQHV
jgi:hypothetical protein